MNIVFFHIGNNEHLRIALETARDSNPNSIVHLIGDSTNRELVKGILWHDHNDFMQGAKDFERTYKHMNTNGELFELVCFARWWAVMNFLKQNPEIEKIFYADSDVLVFSDLEKVYNDYREYRITLGNIYGPYSMFIKNDGIIDEFCNFCLDVYSGKDSFTFETCRNHFLNLQKHQSAGGVCDMTLWEQFRKKTTNPGLIGEMSIIINDSTFDHNINSSDGYEMKKDIAIKKIYMIKGMPHAKNLSDGRMIKLHTIHFQGMAKSLMKEVLDDRH